MIPRKRTIFVFVFMFMLISLFIGETVSRAYIPEYNFRPSDGAIMQLNEIRNRYGFDNQSVLVIISTKKLKASYYWPMMIVGSNIYLGCLLDLIAGKPDFIGNTYPDWEERDILIPIGGYPLNPIERAMTTEIMDGVYKVVNKTLLVDALTGVYELYSSLKEMIRNSSKFMQDSPIFLDTISDNSLKIQYGFSYTQILISSSTPNRVAEAEFVLPTPGIFTSFLIGYRGKLSTSIVRVDLVSSSNEIVSSIYLRPVEHRNLIEYTSFAPTNITSIHFVIYIPYPTITNPDFAIIDFIAFS